MSAHTSDIFADAMIVPGIVPATNTPVAVNYNSIHSQSASRWSIYAYL